MVIVVDFDGTIVDSKYPNIMGLKEGAKEVINKYFNLGHEIIINTCRSGKFEGDAQMVLDDNGIKYTYINSNLPRLIEKYGADCRKISGDVYIDDKNIGCKEINWNEIDKQLEEMGKFKDLSIELKNVGSMIERAKNYGLRDEVVFFAMKSLKDDPKLSIEQAMINSLNEWDL